MSQIETDPTRRFSRRVDDYVKYRPTYPLAVLDLLIREAGLKPGMVVADIGSGTGLLARLFLDAGYEVYGVEPNDEMRAAAEEILAGYPRFHSVNGRAEATTLEGQSVDLISAGQAFHWFDLPAARREFERILKPGGYVVLVWNDWGTVATPFNQAYQAIVARYGLQYDRVKHSNASEGDAVADFFAPGAYRLTCFDFQQRFDLAGIQGRLLSSSYSPTADDAGYEAMLAELAEVFDRYQEDGQIRFGYETSVFHGRLIQ
jgi:SAM-dependent methyltransferase